MTQYGARAEREMEYFPLKDRSPAIQRLFAAMHYYWSIGYHAYVWITAVPMIIAWIGALLIAASWIVPQTEFRRLLMSADVDILVGPIIAVSALLLYEDLATSMFSQPHYRYFHITEPWRLVIGGFGAVFVMRVVSVGWGARLAAVAAGPVRQWRERTVSAIQEDNLVWRMRIAAIGARLTHPPRDDLASISENAALALQRYELICRTKVAAIAIGLAQATREGIVAAIQKRDCLEGYFGPRRRAWIFWLVGVNAGLFAWWTSSMVTHTWGPPSPTVITVVEATYGAICQDFVPKPPIVNAVRPGNATKAVASACNRKDGTCRFTVDPKIVGDPASGCGKDFVVRWRCGPEATVNQTTIAAEAVNQSVDLRCPPRVGG